MARFYTGLILLLIIWMPGSYGACPSTVACSCNSYPRGDYEWQCSSDSSRIQITVHHSPNKHVYFECSSYTTVSDYEQLPVFNLEKVELVRFTMCPWNRNLTFKGFLEKVGIHHYNILRFQSFGENAVRELTMAQLDGLNDVSRIEFTGSGLTNLSVDLLKPLTNLTWLDLRSNTVLLPDGIFTNTPMLQVLELGDNNISQLPADLFSKLTNLKRLNLWNNNLINLDEQIFAHLSNLEELDLHRNNLITFPHNIFKSLLRLKYLNLNSNKFTTFPSDLLQNNTALEKFFLFNNENLLTLPNGLLSNLPQLQLVDLYACKLMTIPVDIFWNSPAIKNLSLVNNFLTALPVGIFKNNKQLYSLRLGNNLLKELPDDLLAPLENLHILEMNNNKIKTLSSKTFRKLSELVVLNLNDNHLHHIDNHAFATNLKLTEILLSNNQLNFNTEDSIQITSPFGNLKNLSKLNLAKNLINRIEEDWRISLLNLKSLNLSSNVISYIEFTGSLQFLSRGLILDLRKNNISVIEMDSIESHVWASGQQRLDAYFDSKPTTKVLLSENPLTCNCTIYHLLRFLEGKMDSSVQALIEFETGNLKCADPPELAGKLVTNINSNEVTCNYSNAEQCPAKCKCTIRPADHTLIVDCSNRGLYEAPTCLPIARAYPNVVIHLENNNIDALIINENATNCGYQHVRELYAFNNSISFVSGIENLTLLQVLEVHDNLLTDVNIAMLRALPRLERVGLDGNPLVCDCETLELLNFVKENYDKIMNISSLSCVNSDLPLAQMSVDELCPTPKAALITGVILLIVIVIAVSALFVCYYRYELEIKVWMFAHNICLGFVSEYEVDKDKQYDAFVSYSHRDEDFVVNELIPNLENGEKPFKLCVHFRDWIAGEWIPNQIARSVEDSRRTLVVLSSNFLESVWGKMEFRSAHLNALQEGRSRVIVIKYGDIGPHEELDSELRAYLTMNTYIEWGDKAFWDKLKYALPHRPQLSKRGALISQRIKQSLETRIELQSSGEDTMSVKTPIDIHDDSPLVIKIVNDKLKQDGLENPSL